MIPKIAPQLVAETRPYITRIRNLPFLKKAEQGKVGVTGWHRFALERYHAARYFVPLIEKGEALTRAANDNELLHHAYHSNLMDERGLSVPGAGSHESWRIDFYAAMGIAKETLQQPYLNEGTRFYIDTLKSLIDEGDIYKISGALLFLEVTIPHEYRKILKGIEQDFPAAFDISDGETEEKRKARHYLVDHIHHDAAVHARDMLIALSDDAANPDVMARLQTGMEMGMKAKEEFYKGL